MLRKYSFIFGILFASNCMAEELCNLVVDGYEYRDTMYVICDNLTDMSDDKASELANVIMDQYKGPPDEIVVYFIKSEEFLGKREIPAEEYVGFIYTHSHNLVVWPEIPSLKQEYDITWD